MILQSLNIAPISVTLEKSNSVKSIEVKEVHFWNNALLFSKLWVFTFSKTKVSKFKHSKKVSCILRTLLKANFDRSKYFRLWHILNIESIYLRDGVTMFPKVIFWITLQYKNMDFVFVTPVKSKFDKSTDVKDSQSLNIDSVSTRWGLVDVPKDILVKPLQPLNIALVLVTEAKLQLDKSSDFNEEHPWNVVCMFSTADVSGVPRVRLYNLEQSLNI